MYMIYVYLILLLVFTMYHLARRSNHLLKNVSRRMYSATSYQFLDIQNSGKGYSVLEMKKKPVNSLSLEMIQEVNTAFDSLEKDKDCRGVIITSKLPVFCAGLDILEMYNPNNERLREFWTSFQNMKLKLFSSPMVLIAAINGACPAGGCAIAFSCDYRIFADGKHTMGLNETHLGLAAPWWLCESLKLLVGQRESERMLCLGEMSQPSQALSKGMVDEVVPLEDVLSVAEKEMTKWLKIADLGRIQTKKQMREKFLSEFNERREEDLKSFVYGIEQPGLQKLLGKYLEALKKKK